MKFLFYCWPNTTICETLGDIYLTADPREQQNVAGDHPDTVQELDAILTAERQKP